MLKISFDRAALSRLRCWGWQEHLVGTEGGLGYAEAGDGVQALLLPWGKTSPIPGLQKQIRRERGSRFV